MQQIEFAGAMPAKRLTKTVAAYFGVELRSARAEAGLTQQALAERAEVDPVFISLLENGHRQPSLTVALSLERVLGLEPGDLSRRVARQLHRDGTWPRKKGQARD